MIRVNENYLKLKASYLFVDIAKRVAAFTAAHPEKKVIRMGIGDVTRPLPPVCIKALHEAADEMAAEATFKGYGPEAGYEFLREAIAENDYRARGCQIGADEIFVSDGAKCDTANIQELFAGDIKIAVPDPVYPVYVDTNVMAGRTGENVGGRYQGFIYLNSTAENNFIPELPKEKVDLIYLCFPNNPTGAAITKAELKKWVDYAKENKSLILYDAAYEAFIRDESLPRSIYEIDGAGSEKSEGVHGFGRGGCPQPAVEPPAVDEIQRRFISDSKGRSRRLHRRRQSASESAHRFLFGKRKNHPRKNDFARVCMHRRRKFAVYLGSDRQRKLEFFRQAAERSGCCHHAGVRLWLLR